MNEVAQRIEEHVPSLQRYALALCRNAAAADDLVQECVVRGLTKAHLYQSGTNLRAWLFTIMHNLHVSDLRRNGKWKQPADPDAALDNLSVSASQPATVMLRAVSRAMMALPDLQRVILYCVGVEGKSYEEVSREFGIPVGTVKSRCFRAREAVQKRLSEPGMSETRLSLVG
ncbi:MAG: RNA polymerase sigma factor [Alphaproteobacteria bacterium]